MFSTPAITHGDNDNADIAEDPTSNPDDAEDYVYGDYIYDDFDYGKFSVQFLVSQSRVGSRSKISCSVY